MPRALALSFTASSRLSGTRMLTCASFFSNSKCIGLNCVKSRSDRSCLEKTSASSSVRRTGTLRDPIESGFLGMHIPRAYGPNVLPVVDDAVGEHDEYRASP